MRPTTDADAVDVAVGVDVADLSDWATRLYSLDEVREACLALQDEHGADVVAVLATAWAVGAAGASVADGRIADVVRWATTEQAWHDDVVAPLRRARRAVSDDPLRQQIGRAEIEAELTQFHRLSAVATSPDGSGWQSARSDPSQPVASYARDCAAQLLGAGRATAEAVALVATVLTAATSDAPSQQSRPAPQATA